LHDISVVWFVPLRIDGFGLEFALANADASGDFAFATAVVCLVEEFF
jgi:hypothetical protein